MELKFDPTVKVNMYTPMFRGTISTIDEMEIDLLRSRLAKAEKNAIPRAKKILKNGDYMTVLWADGTKTIVKRAADEAESDYAAFTAALGIKCFGSNSALKRIVATAEEQGKKKKKKKKNEGNAEAENPFEKVASEISKAFHEGDILRALEDIKEGNREAYRK